MIIFHVRGGYWFRGSRTGFSRPKTMCHKKIVLKFKSIVMRIKNNLFRRVHNCTNFKWWFTQFERKFFLIFHYFQYFERFRSMKKWQISKLKIVDWYLDFSNESYTTLKSVISSFKICFQNYGQLKRKFLRPKKKKKYFSEIWAFQTRWADAKNSEKCNKKSVWATVV